MRIRCGPNYPDIACIAEHDPPAIETASGGILAIFRHLNYRIEATNLVGTFGNPAADRR
jgi:hypothetical protein